MRPRRHCTRAPCCCFGLVAHLCAAPSTAGSTPTCAWRDRCTKPVMKLDTCSVCREPYHWLCASGNGGLLEPPSPQICGRPCCTST